MRAQNLLTFKQESPGWLWKEILFCFSGLAWA